MASWEDVARLATAMPGASEELRREMRFWSVNKTLFVWERPLRKADLAALGLAEQEGPVLGARVPDEGAKLALIADNPAVYFTIPHFDGYPAILVRLDEIDLAGLEELIVEAWLCRAQKRAVQQWLDEHPR